MLNVPKYTIEKVCGDEVRHYNGAKGTYDVLFPSNNVEGYSLAFFPYENKSAPIAKCNSWEFVPTGEKRFYQRYERLIDAERAIEQFERRLTKQIA